jgi:hypothetical protein
MKKTILLITMGFALITQTLFAQVPTYVPTNGLVGYWSFTGNVNDESGNGNNCNNPVGNYDNDRNGIANSSFYGNGLGPIPGSGMFISSLNNFPLVNSNRSITVWFKCNLPYPGGNRELFSYGDNTFGTRFGIMLNDSSIGVEYMIGSVLTAFIPDNNWHNLTVTYNGTGSSGILLYLDGILKTTNIVNPIGSLNTLNSFIKTIGRLNDIYNFSGNYDDIGIWNRALTQQEITNLYNSVSSNECLTMTINTGVLSTTPVTYTSSVSIYPNPANDQITIDCGNLANVSGWKIKITNALGQEVFNQPMNTQQYVVPLNTWSGQGMYFVKIINTQNEVVNIKKIILQ